MNSVTTMRSQLNSILCILDQVPKHCDVGCAVAWGEDESSKGRHFPQAKLVVPIQTFCQMFAGMSVAVSLVGGRKGELSWAFVYGRKDDVLIESKYLAKAGSPESDVLHVQVVVDTPESMPEFVTYD